MLGTNHSYLCPHTTKSQLKHFHSDQKNFWPPNLALPLFRHILQQPVPLIQTPASSLNFAPDQLFRLLRALLFVLLPWEKNRTHNSSTKRVIVAGVFPTEYVAKSGEKKATGLPYYRLKTPKVVKKGQNWPPIGIIWAETPVRGDLSQKSTYSNSICPIFNNFKLIIDRGFSLKFLIFEYCSYHFKTKKI